MGSFIMPKNLIKSFDSQKPSLKNSSHEKLVIRDKKDCSFSIAKNAQQYMQSNCSKKPGSKISGDIDMIENNNRRAIEVITSRHKSSSYVLLNMTSDFFGLLQMHMKDTKM